MGHCDVNYDPLPLVEGFATPAGASFQMDALRMVSQAPVKGALNTHHHLDHSIGNAFYGTRGIEVWAHPAVARRIVDSYTPLQGATQSGGKRNSTVELPCDSVRVRRTRLRDP